MSFVHKGLCFVCSVLRETEIMSRRGVESLGSSAEHLGLAAPIDAVFPLTCWVSTLGFPWAAMAQGRVIGEAYQRSARTLDHRVLACERERKGCERREIAEGRITEYVYAPFLFPPAQVVAGGRPTLSHTTKMNVKSMTIVGQRVISETKTRVDPTKTSGGGGWA